MDEGTVAGHQIIYQLGSQHVYSMNYYVANYERIYVWQTETQQRERANLEPSPHIVFKVRRRLLLLRSVVAKEEEEEAQRQRVVVVGITSSLRLASPLRFYVQAFEFCKSSKNFQGNQISRPSNGFDEDDATGRWATER